ncbi:MAG: DUF6263 family protein [Capnocytophaga sp.]|nr:DUF6263 family protein [Capnocytophaga sp.]
MKKIVYIYFIFSSLSVFSQQIDLSLRLDNKKTYYQNMTLRVASKQSIQKQEVTTNVEVKSLTSFTFGKEKQGIYPTEIAYKNAEIEMETQVNGEKIQFGDMEKNIKEVTKNILNTPFKGEISVKGKILKINDNSFLFDKAMRTFMKNLQKNTSISLAEQRQIRDQVEKSFSADILKSNLENLLSIFPRKRVSVGDQWEIQTFLINDLNIKISTTYTLESFSEEDIFISGNAVIHFTKEPVQLEQGQQVFFSVNGNISSQIKLDATTKWIKEAHYKQQIKGETEVEGDLSHRKRAPIPFENSSEVIINNK